LFGGHTQALSPNGGALAGVVESAKAIAAAREQLNGVAKSFATGVNALQAAGDTLANIPGTDMFEIGDPESNLTMKLTDPRSIAAADRGKGNRDNGNLLKFETLRGENGAEQLVTGIVTNNGAALNARKGVVEAQSAIRDNAVMSRDAVTGVNVDEEAVDLIRFQQAYQASSRVIQVARDVMQSILEIR
jgi:flagellar hook-associated protein 1